MYNNDFYSKDDRINTIYGSSYAPEQKKDNRKRIMMIIGLVLLVAAVSIASCAAYFAATGKASSKTQGFQVNQVAATATSAQTTGALSTVDIVNKVRPSVVGISTTLSMGSGSGSGMIFSDDGYIVTNQHVINGATSITVTLSDDTEYEATLVGEDEQTDLAVLKINAKDLPTVEVGDSDILVQGETAIVIGNPMGEELSGSVSQGIISALGREIEIDNRIMHYIQTDAAINSGNSGGPLINGSGQVIGITSAKINSSVAEGLGFAIPINEAVPIIEELINNGYVTGRPMIGISGENITEQISMFYNLPQGVCVRYVDPSSGAYAAGIQAGDVITAANDTPITSLAELNKVRDTFSAGDTIKLTIYRNGQTTTVDVVLGNAHQSSN